MAAPVKPTTPTTLQTAKFHNPLGPAAHRASLWIHAHHLPRHLGLYLILGTLAVIGLAVAWVVGEHRAKQRAKKVKRAIDTAKQCGVHEPREHKHVFARRPVVWTGQDIQSVRIEHDGHISLDVERKLGAGFCRIWQTPVDVHPDDGWVRVSRRPPRPVIPLLVDHPATTPVSGILPFGTGENNQIVSWQLDASAPHALVIGPTGTGKTVTLIGLTIEACRQPGSPEVYVLDPKRVEFVGLEGWPNIVTIATELDEMASVIDLVWNEMESRYKRIKAKKIRLTDLTRLVLVVDELTELLSRFNEVHTGRGLPPAFIQFQSLVRLARKARVNVLCGLQRPDAKFIGGETRSNFGFAVGLGELGPEGKKMIGAKIDISDDLPEGHQGRSIVVSGRRQTEVQGWRIPDPADTLTPADQAILDALLPHGRPVRTPSEPPSQPPSETPSGRVETPETALTETPPKWDGRKPIPAVFYQWMQRLDSEGLNRAEIGRTLGISRPIVSTYLSKLAAPAPSGGSSPPRLRLVRDEDPVSTS